MPIILDSFGNPDTSAPAGGDLIKDSDTTNFVADVIDMSREVPVIVDFWAPWCGPCKQLGPLLERLVQKAGGIVRLVKINVDENQDLAAQLRVQSIPAVYGFRDGRAVDGFVGAQPESNIRVFIDRLTKGAKPPVEAALEQARELMDGGRVEDAFDVYNAVVAQDPGNPDAIGGALRCLVSLGQLEEAHAFADSLTPELARHAAIEGALSALKLIEQAGKAGDVSQLRQKVQADPGDLPSRYDLAVALFGRGDANGAADELLEIVRRDRTWNDDAGRKKLIEIFEALGPKNPVTLQARKRLSSILFS